MADNPYTSATISNFNQNPPPDDGTTTAANQLTWAKHLTKLANPIKTFADDINANASTAGTLTVVNTADQPNLMAGSYSYASSELTTATGSVAAVRSHHTIDTQADAGTDDLDTITVAGVSDGAILYLRLANAARVVTLKDNTGNIQTKNNEDIVLDANIPTVLFRVGADWFEVDRPVVDNPFDQDLNTTDSPAFASGVVIGTLTFTNGNIADSGGSIDFNNENLTTTGVIIGATFDATADGTSGDNSTLGFSATEGATLRGQGSTNDVTIKNDADVAVIEIPTGTNSTNLAGDATLADGRLNVTESEITKEAILTLNSNATFGAFAHEIDVTRAANATAFGFIQCKANAVKQAKCLGDGDWENINNSYGAISDIKLKQDISLASSQWDDIKAIGKIVSKYRLKSQVKEDPNAHYHIGVIAQKLEKISPGLVRDTPDEDGETTKAVKSSVLYMKGIKALGEALERIEILEAEVIELKK